MAGSSKREATGSNGENAKNVINSDDGSISTEKTVSNQRNTHNLKEKLSNHKDNRKYGSNNNITIVRSNKLLQALQLPKVTNLNPRSIYNKVDEFCAFVDEEEIDIVFLSESHERWYPTKKGENQNLNVVYFLVGTQHF